MPPSSSPPLPLSKRKLEDYLATATEDANQQNDAVPPTTRMRTDDAAAVVPTPPYEARRPRGIQFFVRMLDKTLVLHADPTDTVRSIHEKIESIAKISAAELRLTYGGKQLQWDQTLIDCGVENDANLHLIGRMRSTRHPRAWQLMNDVVSLVFDLISDAPKTPEATPSAVKNPNNTTKYENIKSTLEQYLLVLQSTDHESSGYLQVFNESSAAAALVMLYTSAPNQQKKDLGDEAIRYFVEANRADFPSKNCQTFAPIVLDFCNLLRARAGADDPLYGFCRSNLGTMLSSKCVIKSPATRNFWVKEILPFLRELAGNLSQRLTNNYLPSAGPVKALADFLAPLRKEIEEAVVRRSNGGRRPIKMPLCVEKATGTPSLHPEEVTVLHGVFLELLGKMDKCLSKVEEHTSTGKLPINYVIVMYGWSGYLFVLKELFGISKLYEDGERRFREVMWRRRNAWNHLAVKRAKRGDDHRWILEFKGMAGFEARRHLAMMTLADSKLEYDDALEMLIDRSHLLSESFEYVKGAHPQTLRSGLLVEFKKEKAAGPGVLREWFLLVCQAIFNPENALFLACPDDRRRFYPNPASKVHPLHLEYFKFSGRVVALALVHKVQVGIVFDPVFVAQLSGEDITLEDVRTADPVLYKSCKEILSMDPEDVDVLTLTFAYGFEELGTKKSVELLPGGSNIAVNSKNREDYVDLLIRYRFVESISEQVAHFVMGFSDIASSNELRMAFFKFLETGDLDMMLHGSERPICVDDWKAHTDYKGYEESDSHISWFWKVVEGMSPEQKKVLLFFWTSLKYLPVEGFKGLASRLQICKSSGSSNRLPTSHTCFYQLCLPSYKSFSCMSERLHIITQEHVGCSFGTY